MSKESREKPPACSIQYEANYAAILRRIAPRLLSLRCRTAIGSVGLRSSLVSTARLRARKRGNSCGERLEVADLGWHGLEVDRRLAFRRMNDRSWFPVLCKQASRPGPVRSPAPRKRRRRKPSYAHSHAGCEEMPVFGEDLAAEVGRRYGAPVEMMQMKHRAVTG
jgi:hypothetical protein